jgi:hypothetical protein
MAYGKSNMGPKKTVVKKSAVSNKVKSVERGMAKNKTTGSAVLAPARNKYVSTGALVKKARNVTISSSEPVANKRRVLDLRGKQILQNERIANLQKEHDKAKADYLAAKKALNGPSRKTGSKTSSVSSTKVFSGTSKVLTPIKKKGK